MKRGAFLGVLVCYFALLLSAGTTFALDTVRILYSSVNPHALLVSIAEKRGLYAKYGLSSVLDLLAMAASGDAERGKDSPYGQQYEIRGTLNGPSGRSAVVLTVWIIPFGSEVPQFVTAFPGEVT